MKTTLTRESPSKVRLAVEAASQEVAPAVQRAVRALANEIKVPGFRKGKVPRAILETRLGRDAIREAALREAIPELLAKAVQDETLTPVAPPSVDVTSYELDSDLTFDATVEVRPDIELPDFTEIVVTRGSDRADAAEVDAQLERLRNRFASLETVERPSHRGDYVLIDLKATDGDQEISEMSGTDQLYELGAGWPVAQFDDELEGRGAGETVEFAAVLSEEIGGPQAGKELTFRILVKEVRQKVLPELNDEFAKTASEFEALDELRADLVERIRKVKALQSEGEVRNRVLEEALAMVEIEPPESLVREEMAFRLRRFEEQLKGAGMTLDGYMQQQGVSEEQLEQDLLRQAETNVRAQLLLEEVGRRENFTISQEELGEEVRYHAEALRADPSELAKQLGSSDRLTALAGDIIRRKALNHLVGQADIREEDNSTGAAAGDVPLLDAE
ncbi:MAG: trigger factor [Actinomycetota bacterium]